MGVADENLWESRAAFSEEERSVGEVQTYTMVLPLPPEGFRCTSGEVLPIVEVAWESYGQRDSDDGNTILVTPPLTANAHVAGFHRLETGELGNRGWWDAMIGPGKAIDTSRFHVVCASLLGGCSGTTGPASRGPEGQPWGAAFPRITIGDMVEVQRLFLKALGIEKIYAVVGGSMGGMQALEWAVRHPDMVERCICIAAAASLSAQALAFDIVGREAVEIDPHWDGGAYLPGQTPTRGLALARKIAHITYLSPQKMAFKFGRAAREGDAPPERFHTTFEVENYLRHQGERFVTRFDANSYMVITQAMDDFDLASAWGRTPWPEVMEPEVIEQTARIRLREAFERSRARFLVVAVSSDWLFPSRESWKIAETLLESGREASFVELASPHGHDGFLLEVRKLDEAVQAFLGDGHSATSAIQTTSRRGFFRDDGQIRELAQMVPRGARVLDLGCGDGALLKALIELRDGSGIGVDIDPDAVIATLARGIPALQWDLDSRLSVFADGSFDLVVLNHTLQMVGKPMDLLEEMLRVGREGIVGFSNWGNWRCRAGLLLRGRMPRDVDRGHSWHDTPDWHPFSLADFLDACRRLRLQVREVRTSAEHPVGKVLSRMGWTNAGAEKALVRISRFGDQP